MTDRVLIATQNAHKVNEIRALLEGVPVSFISLAGMPPIDPPEETGFTFEANAELKARFYAAALNMACVADDSGIEVDALNGAPGVFSARYAGESATDEENNRKLIAELRDIPDHARTARFVCCAAFVAPESECHIMRGTIEGRIAFACRGDNGFGYDSLFVPDGYSDTFGVIDPAIKMQISHRATAFRQLRALWPVA